jgi:hypothetical protein
MKVPVCLSRGGLVEVGLSKTDLGLGSGSVGKTDNGEEDQGTLRRLIFVRTFHPFFPLTYPSLLPCYFRRSDPWKFLVAGQLGFMVFLQPNRNPKYAS